MKIAITGAAGSLGRRLIWHCARVEKAERIVAIIRSEYDLAMHHDLFKRVLFPQEFERIHWMKGDVTNLPRMTKALHGCESIIHAAALKRVDSLLDNPTETIETNIFGVVTMLEAAMANSLKKFIFVSSDKAVAPENAYGATKMLGEHLVRCFNAYSLPRGMECLSVRYGNVLGSRGSVYWIWRKELEKEFPRIQLTHQQMTRYFMTFKMAIDTIMVAYYQGQAGHTIIPLCQSYYLTNFINALVEICASAKKHNVVVETCGLRKGGEKLHESLCTQRELYESVLELRRGPSKFLALCPDSQTTIQSLPKETFLLNSNVLEYPTNQLIEKPMMQEINTFTFEDTTLAQFDTMQCIPVAQKFDMALYESKCEGTA